MAKMKVAQVGKAHGDFEIVERDIPEPGPGGVRIKVHACGICHSDVITKEALFPGISYPRVPGHEVAWRTGWHVFTVPTRGFRDVRERQDFGH
jgi:D-arabinose 1-dehydrogenase-like Zn-dependent alcohol dehydrogenase